MQALIRTACTTGLFYLGLAITGALGFLVIRSQLFAAGDPVATLAQLVDNYRWRARWPCWSCSSSSPRRRRHLVHRLLRTADPLAASGIAAPASSTPSRSWSARRSSRRRSRSWST